MVVDRKVCMVKWDVEGLAESREVPRAMTNRAWKRAEWEAKGKGL